MARIIIPDKRAAWGFPHPNVKPVYPATIDSDAFEREHLCDSFLLNSPSRNANLAVSNNAGYSHGPPMSTCTSIAYNVRNGNQCLTFNGSSSLVNLPVSDTIYSHENLSNNSTFTVEVVYATSSTQGDMTLYGEGWSGGTNPVCYISLNTNGTNGYLRTYYRNDSKSQSSLMSWTDAQTYDGKIHVVHWVREVNAVWRLYFDGEEVASDTSTVSNTKTNQTNLGVLDRTSGQYWYNGDIYAYNKWIDRWLTPAEIRARAKNLYGMFTPSTPIYVEAAAAAGLPAAVAHHHRHINIHAG